MTKITDIPAIRFKGFSDTWEQRKFGELFSRRMERNLGQFDNTRWISVARMYFQDPDRVTSNNIDTRTYVMREGDIAFEGHSNQEYRYGRFVANDIGDGVISELFPIYQHIVPYDNNYWKYAIQIETIMAPKILRCIEISYTSSNKLDEKFFLEESTSVPGIEEQRKIGALLSNLDNLIALHQRKYDKLTNVKKSMLEKMFPQNGSNAPEIRFKGFTEAWEQRKLDTVAKFSKGSGYSKGDLIETGTPIILYGRLYTKYETSISDVDTYVEAKEGSVYSKGGEVIVPASGETAEDIARAATVDKSGILLGGDLNVVMPNEDINSAFLAISISNGNSQRELAKKAQGKSVVHIHNEEIRNLIVPFPIKAEQNRIVDYFSTLDHLITLHQRELEKLKNIKKSCLENMFV